MTFSFFSSQSRFVRRSVENKHQEIRSGFQVAQKDERQRENEAFSISGIRNERRPQGNTGLYFTFYTENTMQEQELIISCCKMRKKEISVKK